VNDWCKSPHGFADPRDESLRNSGNKCRLARPLTMPNFVILLQKMSEIPAIENLCSWKSGPKFTKIWDDLLRTNAPYFARSVKRCTRKALQFFYILKYFGALGDSLGQSSLIWVVLYSKAPSIKLPNFIPFWKPSYEIYMLPKFVDFVDGVTGTQTYKR